MLLSEHLLHIKDVKLSIVVCSGTNRQLSTYCRGQYLHRGGLWSVVAPGDGRAGAGGGRVDQGFEAAAARAANRASLGLESSRVCINVSYYFPQSSLTDSLIKDNLRTSRYLTIFNKFEIEQSNRINIEITFQHDSIFRTSEIEPEFFLDLEKARLIDCCNLKRLFLYYNRQDTCIGQTVCHALS